MEENVKNQLDQLGNIIDANPEGVIPKYAKAVIAVSTMTIAQP